MKNVWGCEKPTQMSVPTFEYEDREYWNCPLRYVPSNIWEFLSEYGHAKKFPSVPMPRLRNMAKRARAAIALYEMTYSEEMLNKAKRNG
jgi:hypothetical protein